MFCYMFIPFFFYSGVNSVDKTLIPSLNDELSNITAEHQFQYSLLKKGIFLNNASEREHQKYYCDFENGICDFLDTITSEDWELRQGVSNQTDFRPPFDHTLGTGIGSYAYVDLSDFRHPESLIYIPPILMTNIDLRTPSCINFFYFMNTKDETCKFEVILSSSNKTVKYFVHKEVRYRFVLRGKNWKELSIDTRYFSYTWSRTYKLAFVVRVEPSTKIPGFIAIDDVSITPGQCPDFSGNAQKICDFDYHDCGYTSKYVDGRKWERKYFSRMISDDKLKNIFDHTLDTKFGGFMYLRNPSNATSIDEKSFLTSPMYNKPKQNSSCLQFYYYWESFEGIEQDHSIDAYYSFSIKNEFNVTKQFFLKIATLSTARNEWRLEQLKMNIPYDFQIYFSAFSTYHDSIAALDDIIITEGSCPRSASSCTTTICKNGGTCVRKEEFEVCICPEHYSGVFCDKVKTFGSSSLESTTEAMYETSTEKTVMTEITDGKFSEWIKSTTAKPDLITSKSKPLLIVIISLIVITLVIVSVGTIYNGVVLRRLKRSIFPHFLKKIQPSRFQNFENELHCLS